MSEKKRKCPSCGSEQVTWEIQQYTTSGVQDGRLRLNEVKSRAVMGCGNCSETITTIEGDDLMVYVLTTHELVKQQVKETYELRDQVAIQAGKVHQRNDVIRSLLAIVDEELMPNVGKLAVQDYQRLNETLIAARKLLEN